MRGCINVWSGERNWLLEWQRTEVLPGGKHCWIEWSAGPPAGEFKHRQTDPQVTGVVTNGRLEFRTVGTIEWDSTWHHLLSQTVDRVRRLAGEYL